MSKISKVCLTPARCAVDLGDGSERGFYVNQDYILHKLNRPHRGISLMYTYYPLDETWPARAQDAYADKEVNFAWDYPYDNYFPYAGGLTPNDGDTFRCMKDVRRHGQDVILTLTVDPRVSDEHIIAIAKDLSTYGRMLLRLNHECTGDWFSFTKRASYQEIADFFVRFKKILSEYAPNVSIILCAGAVTDVNAPKLEKEEEFFEASKVTDYWSVDNYFSLNWGWPYEVAEKDNFSHQRSKVAEIYDKIHASYLRYREITGMEKPMVMSEMNADGDVTGPYDQAEMVREFMNLVKNDPDQWLSGFTCYQFRDDGRLGLEFTDPNNSEVGIEWPLLKVYRDLIQDEFFCPGKVYSEADKLPVTLRWGGAEDAEGISMDLEFEKDPVFAEANFEGELADANLMMEINGKWFYKAPGVKYIDFMSAFFDKKLQGPTTVKLNIFAPPATGENDPAQGEDWQTNYYYEMKELPKIRLRFEPVM